MHSQMRRYGAHRIHTAFTLTKRARARAWGRESQSGGMAASHNIDASGRFRRSPTLSAARASEEVGATVFTIRPGAALDAHDGISRNSTAEHLALPLLNAETSANDCNGSENELAGKLAFACKFIISGQSACSITVAVCHLCHRCRQAGQQICTRVLRLQQPQQPRNSASGRERRNHPHSCRAQNLDPKQSFPEVQK